MNFTPKQQEANAARQQGFVNKKLRASAHIAVRTMPTDTPEQRRRKAEAKEFVSDSRRTQLELIKFIERVTGRKLER